MLDITKTMTTPVETSHKVAPKPAPINPKVLVCAFCKMENRYIMEWIEYYKQLGADHIIIYDNNEKNGERFEEVIPESLLNSYVTIVDYRGKQQTACQAQVEAYTDCYRNRCQGYDWVTFLDIDEFFVDKRGRNLKEFLSDPLYSFANVIRINWKCYTDNNLEYYDNRPVRERFTEVMPNCIKNVHYKSFFRTGIDGLMFPNVHYSSFVPFIYSADGDLIPYTSDTKLKRVSHNTAWVAHYCTKSMEEFIECKIKRRGKGPGKSRLNEQFYWYYNVKTPEKEARLKKWLAKVKY